MAEDKTGAAGGGGRWTRVVLFLSLAANLLIVGAIAGAAYRGHRDFDAPGAAMPLRDTGFGLFAEALSPGDRRALARSVAEHAGDLRANRDALRRQLGQFLAALRHAPYDPATVRGIVAEQQQQLAQRQAIGQNLLLERIEAMSDSERRAFADRLERALRRGPRPE